MLKHGLVHALPAARAIVLGLACGAVLIVALGQNPLDAYGALLKGALGGTGLGNLQGTLNRAAMIVGCALAAGLTMRAGLLNLGIEGQMVLGGVTGALAALALPLHGWLGMLVAMLAAALAGAAWAMLGALMHLRFGVPLLIGSLLLNYPAAELASWLVSHPYRDIASGMAASARVPPGLRLPGLAGSDVGLSVAVAALLGAGITLFFSRTAPGYEARMAGLNPRFALTSGVATARLHAGLVAASGAMAGLFGAFAVLGEHHRYIDGMLVTPLYAWTGLMAVLLGGMAPAAMVLAGCFFAILQTGALGMERTADVPREIARVLLACVIFFVAARRRQGQGDEA